MALVKVLEWFSRRSQIKPMIIFPPFLVPEIIASFAYCYCTFLQPGAWGSLITFFPALATGITVYVVIVFNITAAVVHFNPAITMCFLAARKIDFRDASVYFLAQVLGGILAALYMFPVMRDSLMMNTTFSGQTLFSALNPCPNTTTGIKLNCDQFSVIHTYALDHNSHSNFAGLLTEIVGSAIMCLATLVAVYNKDFDEKTGALMLGFAVFLGISAGTKVGAGCLNPLRTSAPWLFHPLRIVENWVFTVGPMLGAVLASVIYRFVYDTNSTNDVLNENKDVEKV